jgi:cell division septum initiation protein DivIVA
MSVNSIYKLLDKQEMMILKGTPVPFSPFVMVNHEKLIDILDKIRASIPGEIQEAHSILRKSEEIQVESQKRAEMILAKAKSEAERILSESELLKAVQQEADRLRKEVISEAEAIRARAQEEAEKIKMSIIDESIKIREGADAYAENVLVTLENNLTEMHSTVKNGQKHLEKVKAESIAMMTGMRGEQEYKELQKEPKPLSYKIKK